MITQQNDWTTPAALRNQRTEAEYSRERARMNAAKAEELKEVDERYRILKNAFQLERTTIKEEFALKRLSLKTRIERLKDLRANLRHALSVQACEIDPSDSETLVKYTTDIDELEAQRIGLSRQEMLRLADAENRFNERSKGTIDERNAILNRYNKLMEDLRDKYIKQVDENRAAARQERENQEGGDEV